MQFNTTTRTEGILTAQVFNWNDNRNIVNLNNLVCYGLATGSQLTNNYDEVGSSFNCGSVSRIVSTSNHVSGSSISLVPLEGQVFSILIIDVGSQSNNTVSTDSVFSWSYVNNRSCRYEYQEVFSFRSTTELIVGNNEFEDIRFSSVRSVDVQGSSSLTIDHNAWFIPSVGIISSICNDRVISDTIESNIVTSCSFANVSVTIDSISRVRSNANFYFVINIVQWEASAWSLSNSYIVNMSSDFIVNRHWVISECITSYAYNNFVILVPSEYRSVGSVTTTNVSVQCNNVTFADSGVNAYNSNAIYNRSRNNINSYRVADCSTMRISLECLVSEGWSRSQSSSISSIVCTWDWITIDVPYKYQVLSILIIHVSGQGNSTIFADQCIISCNMNDRIIIYIYEERFAQDSTSVRILNLEVEAVWIISVRFVEWQNQTIGSWIVNRSIVFIPLISVSIVGSINVWNHISSNHNIQIGTVANDRIAWQLDSRIRNNPDSVGWERVNNWFATSGSLFNNNLIDVHGNVVVNCKRIINQVFTSWFHLNAIAVPSVNFTTRNTTFYCSM